MPINLQEIPAGTHREIHLDIERLPSGTLIHLPALVFRGAEPGPTLLLPAALHGDEVNGTETLRRLAAQGKLMPQFGTVISVPIVNAYGFLHQTRTLPDGRDLNRCFPGSTKGSLASRLARTVMTELVAISDYVRFDELAIQKAMEGILRLMHHLDMCAGAPEPFTSMELDGRKWLRAEVSGMFVRGVEYGREVHKGQILAQMTDPYGHQTYDIIAPFDGHVIGVNNQSVVHAGDALIHLGQER